MLAVESVSVTIGAKRVLDGVDLTVESRQILSLLGPSGSGKSTILKVIAGLVPPTAGTVMWDGADLNAVPAHLRRFGLMFQGYALFPHMNVAENVVFGLRMLDWPDLEIERRLREMLELVGLSGFGHRSVETLSGGEQQRVALARTLAPDPLLVMLDEPLGALDRVLRDRLLEDIPELLRGRSVIYVTHDQDEAFAVADQVALIRDGRIVQIGTRSDLEQRPADQWVREFLGLAK